MTKIEERLKKIQKKGDEMVAQANDEQRRKEETIIKYEKDIKALAPRIAELIAIAIELCKNNIPLGKREKAVIGYHEEFETNGITHKLGFYFRYERGEKYLVGVGIEGGGCCGSDLAINESGTMVHRPDPHYQSYQYFGYNDYCRKCEKFLKNFDDFEKRVNDYVDNL